MKTSKFFSLFLVIFCCFLVQCDNSTTEKNSKQQSMEEIQKKTAIRQKELEQMQRTMNPEAKALAKKREKLFKEGIFPDPCPCGSGESHTHFPSILLNPKDIKNIHATRIGPLLIYAEKIEIQPDQTVKFQAKLINPTNSMYSCILKLKVLTSERKLLTISKLPQFQKSASPLIKNLPETKEVFGKLKIFHLKPNYQFQIQFKLHPGSYLYYDWAKVLNAFQNNNFQLATEEVIAEKPSLLAHSHKPKTSSFSCSCQCQLGICHPDPKTHQHSDEKICACRCSPGPCHPKIKKTNSKKENSTKK